MSLSLEKLEAFIDATIEEEKDRDPNKKTEVEAFRRLADHLKDIPSILYFNPIFIDKYIGEIKPDILWFYPQMGILIIEVKAWDKSFIENLRFERRGFVYNGKRYPNPIAEATRFKENLMRFLERKLKRKQNREQREQNRELKELPVPIEYIIYFPNLTRNQYRNLNNDWFPELVDENFCIFYGDRNIKERLVERLSEHHKEIKKTDILKVRRALFPQLAIAKFDLRISKDEVPLMDIHQEKLLYHFSRGYRILRGTAGSGKTVVLIGKAVQEKAKDRSKKIVIITFANSLANEIKNNLENLLFREELDDISIDEFEITTIDSLIYRLAHKYVVDSDTKDCRASFLKLLERNPKLIEEEDKYDVILCDESQDFRKEVFPVIKSLLKENGLVVFGVDETQRIYEGTDWKWVDVGFKATGKVTILKKSYRNPGKIFKLALEFLKQDQTLMKELKELEAVVTEDGVESIRKDDGEIEFYETNNEFEEVAEIVSNLLKEGAKPEDIFVLTPIGNLTKNFYKAISKSIPKIRRKLHYFSSYSSKELKFIPQNKLVIMPYKSAKGLERPIIIVTGIQLLPYNKSQKVADKRRDRRTLYVALTRAQKKLIITSNPIRESEFARDLKIALNKVFK